MEVGGVDDVGNIGELVGYGGELGVDVGGNIGCVLAQVLGEFGRGAGHEGKPP